jgi:hypothetical protein
MTLIKEIDLQDISIGYQPMRLTSFHEENSLALQTNELLKKIDEFSIQLETKNERESAWLAFNAWDANSPHDRALNTNLFLAWYLFRNRCLAGHNEPKQSFARSYIELSSNITSVDRYLVSQAELAPFDFFETHEILSLNKIYFKSLCLGYRASYAFFECSLKSKPGEIFLAKVIPLTEDQGVVLARGPHLGRRAKAIISELKRNLIEKRRDEFQTEFSLFEADIFSSYLEISYGLKQPVPILD